MAENLRSDGKAVEVVVTKTVTKGDPVKAQGWQGVAMRDGLSGDTVAIETTQREFAFNVEGLTAAKGDVLYIVAATGALTNTSSGNTAFCKVTKAKDSNDIAWAKLLPQLS